MIENCIPVVKLLYPDLTKRDISVSAIFGYYSRSNLTTEELCDKAWSTDSETGDSVYKSFIEKWIIGFKHNSLSEHPSLHFYVENISNIVTKILEANSMGQNGVPVAYMEKSTRYVNMENARIFDLLPQYFNTFLSESPIVWQDKFNDIIDKQMSMYNARLKLYEEICEANGVAKSKAFDSAREYLPSGISTVVGVSLNIRALKEVIVNLLSNGNCEAYIIGEQLLDICCENFSEIIKRDEIMKRVTHRANILRKALCSSSPSESRLIVGRINPNYQFLKSLKPTEIFDYESVRDSIKRDFYNDSGKVSTKKIVHIMNKGLTNPAVALKTFRNVEADMGDAEGSIWSSAKLLNHLFNIRENDSEKINTNDIPEDAYNNCISFDIASDYGSYRDIARHRRIKFENRNFYSHSLIEKIYSQTNDDKEKGFYPNFFSYYLDGIITDSQVDSQETRDNKAGLQIGTFKYYVELTMDILDFIIEMKQILIDNKYDIIESNVLLFELLSYLLPMSSEKRYKIRASLPDLLHLVQERIQPAGHLYYRSVASSIWDSIKELCPEEDFIHLINNKLSPLKEPEDNCGSIWKDISLQIDDKSYKAFEEIIANELDLKDK